MMEWWIGIGLVGQIYALIAIPATLVLVIQTILLIFGIGGDDIDADGVDLNGNGVGDTPGDGGESGLAVFSIRGLMAMAAIGGWSGLVMHSSGFALPVTILLSVAIGFLALVGMAYIMKLAGKLQDNGNIDLGYAVGKVGTVYIPIPAEMPGSGKINVTVQERFLEVGAVTACERKLTTGESVRIVGTDETGLVVVEPLKK